MPGCVLQVILYVEIFYKFITFIIDFFLKNYTYMSIKIRLEFPSREVKKQRNRRSRIYLQVVKKVQNIYSLEIFRSATSD